MTGPGFRLLLVVGGSGLVLSESSAQFVVLRQALVASESSAASDSSALSADGRFVTFVSRARLSPTNTRQIENIYVFDRVAGAIDLETVTADGAAADGPSLRPMLSAEGRYLVFASYATNLLEASDTNARSDIFLRDRSSGTTRRMSIGAGGEDANAASESPAISHDGSTIVFASSASNLITGVELSSAKGIYLVVSVTGTPKVVPLSIDVNGRDGASDSFAPALSGVRQRRCVCVDDEYPAPESGIPQ
jgi:Tol biopolymer transport system component